MKPRAATASDAPAIARIYNEGIDDRVATFETRHRTAGDVVEWLGGRHPVVVVEDEVLAARRWKRCSSLLVLLVSGSSSRVFSSRTLPAAVRCAPSAFVRWAFTHGMGS